MDSNRQGQNTNESKADSLDSNPSPMDSNHLGQIIIRSEVCQLDSNPSSTDSNLLRKIEDKTKNKEMDLNPCSMDSNHSAFFKVRSQGELHEFEFSHIGVESSTGKSCKGFESLDRKSVV